MAKVKEPLALNDLTTVEVPVGADVNVTVDGNNCLMLIFSGVGRKKEQRTFRTQWVRNKETDRIPREGERRIDVDFVKRGVHGYDEYVVFEVEKNES